MKPMNAKHPDLRRGWELLFDGRYMAAIKVFKRHGARHPEDAAECCECIGSCYFNLTRSFAKSAPWYHKALELDPDNDSALNMLANNYAGTPKGEEYQQRQRESLQRRGKIPPANLDDVPGWDLYWMDKFADGWMLRNLFDLTDRLIPVLLERGCQSLLCVGNGIDLEARAFACAGFAVTALEISPLATQFAANYALSAEELARFAYFATFKDDEARLTTLIQTARPVTYVTGSLFDPTICAGPYDVILTRRTLQLFSPERMVEAGMALLARLAPTGVIVHHTHNAYRSEEPLADALQAQGVAIAGRGDLGEFLRANPDRPVFSVFGSSG